MNERPMHWSERPKMYQSAPPTTTGGPSQPQPPKQPKRKGGRSNHSGPSKGLWIALAVVVVVAAAGAATYFWYLPSRDSDGLDATVSSLLADDNLNPAEANSADIEAQSLLRRAMAAMETGYAQVGSFDSAVLTPAILAEIDPSITFTRSQPATSIEDMAWAANNAVDYSGSGSRYALLTLSASGNSFQIRIDKDVVDGVYYFVNGVEQSWAETYDAATTPVEGASSTPGLFENSELGISFEYPSEWIDYVPDEPWLEGALLYVGDSRDPLTLQIGIPTDFIALLGERDEQIAQTTARSVIEHLSGGLGQAETASVTVYEPITDLDVNGTSACTISFLGQSGGSAPDTIWKYVALVTGDRLFLFYFVSGVEQLDENQPLFDAVLDSLKLTDVGQ